MRQELHPCPGLHRHNTGAEQEFVNILRTQTRDISHHVRTNTIQRDTCTHCSGLQRDCNLKHCQATMSAKEMRKDCVPVFGGGELARLKCVPCLHGL